jgi:hypothetical protein
MSDVTRILSAIDQGDPHAAEQFLPLVYDELRRLPAGQMARQKPGQTLTPRPSCMKRTCGWWGRRTIAEGLLSEKSRGDGICTDSAHVRRCNSRFGDFGVGVALR